MSAIREETIPPPENTEILTLVESVLKSNDAKLYVSTSDGSQVELPPVLREIVDKVVSSMRRGNAITLAPHAMRLTTQEAADLLGISRPTLIKLLDSHKIPFETPNRHRRIKLMDLLSYQQARHIERDLALRELAQEAQEAQEFGIYDDPSEKYKAAISEARKKFA